MELTIKVAVDEETKEVKVIDVKIDKIIEKKNQCELSQFARWFDDGSPCWTKNSEYNMALLKTKQQYCNDLLRIKGQLFLNDVYDTLGFPRTKAGQMVGWVYDEKNPIGDNFVDFDIYNERNADFINGYTSSCILDFNVDGNILDYI